MSLLSLSVILGNYRNSLGSDTMTTTNVERQTLPPLHREVERFKISKCNHFKWEACHITSIFSFLWNAKNMSQVSQADRLTAIPWLHCSECVAGIQICFPWHALYCSILASSNTRRHLSIEMKQPDEAPLAPRIMQQVTGAMFLLFSAGRITQTLSHTGTIIC